MTTAYYPDDLVLTRPQGTHSVVLRRPSWRSDVYGREKCHAPEGALDDKVSLHRNEAENEH